ncbi:MAG TPA: TIGR03621 family F420-dependent LLM class oxidoreductase [Thermomicrobiales bacterium]|jgi:probable F420-dependent oxidoreductase
MPTSRPFRFLAAAFTAPSAAAWVEQARRIEAWGYDVLGIGDHFSTGTLAAVPALMAAAAATSTLRVACTVFDNDYRHPALLAKEAATIDLLSDGRLEFGIGAGWQKREYDQTGIPFEPAGVRVGRMEEATRIIKGLWAGGPFSFDGRHYTIRDLENAPRPVQRPHPPIFIGGGGKRLLGFAAREADSVGLVARALPGGGLALAEDSEEELAEKVGWVREAAGARFARLELAILIWRVAVTDTPREAAEEIARARGRTPEQVLASPYYLVGSADAIAERLRALRERHGISHVSVMPPDVEAFAPVVARLAGR